MANTPIRQLEWLESLARFFMQKELEREGTHYASILEELRAQREHELQLAKMSFEERYGPDLARRLREQQRYLKNVRLSDRWAKSRGLRNFSEVLNEMIRLRDAESNPLRWSEYILYLVLPKEERETVPGDLLEEYRTVILPKFGVTLARVWFLKQVAASIWPFLKRRILKAFGLAALFKLLH